MAKLTLSDARRHMQNGRPWCFRLEFQQANPNVASGWSSKFWLATGRSRHEPVEIHYGAIGNQGQVIVKDWSYVEAKAPEKEAKGYVYTDTPYIRVSAATIAAFNAQNNQPVAPPPAPPVQPTPPPAPAVLTNWSDAKAKVAAAIKGQVIELTFEEFPAPWQGAVYHTFKDEFGAFCSKFTGRQVKTWWGTTGPNETTHLFHAHATDAGLFQAVVGWLQGQIGGPQAAPAAPVKLTGPFAKVVLVKAMGQGIWHAMNAAGSKVMDLTKQGARDLVAEYPHIKVLGL